MLKINPSEMQPTKFYQLVDIVESVTPQTMSGLHAFIEMAGKAHKLVEEQCSVLAKANGDLAQQTRNSMMHRNQFDSLEKQQDDFLNFVEEVSDVNFVLIAYDTIRQINMAYINMLDLAKNLKPRPLVLSEKRFTGKAGSFDELQHMMYEFEINAPVLNNFMMALDALDNIDKKIDTTAYAIFMSLETYYKKLLHRHTIEGLKIQRDPVITDIALTVFKNIDSHGEIAKGTKVDEVSAYTVRKAEILAGALRHETVHKFIEDPGKLMEYILMNLKALKSTAGNLQTMFEDQVIEYKLVMEEIRAWSNYDLRTLDNEMRSRKFDDTLMLIGDIDPRNVSYKESDKILSSEEQFNIKFRDETLEEIVKILVVPEFQAQELVTYVLERKSHLKKYFQEENSFYVCKIGGGNPFLGVAPGALEVIPGEKPQADLHNILGSGFDEVRKFIQGIEDAGKWHNLFLATSPSKSTDKSNVLLVGPQGCGKTQVFRAVGADTDSISVSVQGSDFGTCWKGEMEKNPKRMFQEGLKLQKESGRHVHFLIDEIDQVLNDDKFHGSTNLTLEFQILMDGVVNYPNLSVWGATNNPRRIPMPMIRRFSLVLIVGELSQKDRVELIQHYVKSFLPVSINQDKAWNAAATKLEGATGDVIRKVADHIWRTKMSWLVHNKKEAAEELTKMLVDEKGQFDIKKFSDKDRFNFKQRLGKHFKVSAEDLNNSIDRHLNNIAIRSEIDTAVETYSDARKFLDEMNAGKI
jgi:Holliday junction resolvasome RuvABC ATP-dependent DNA helicase subunit